MAEKKTLSSERAELQIGDFKPLYTPGEAKIEADRCLYCEDAPCIQACPTAIDIPRFIKRIAQGNLKGSAKVILDANILGYSCARVCPVEVLCAGACVYNPWNLTPIAIGRLQRFAVESIWDEAGNLFERKPANGKKVALVGGGPASLAAGAALSLEGYEATILEKNEHPGGLNTYGVAPYKMQAQDSLKEVELIEALGVTIKTGVEVGKDITADELLSDYDAVFLGVGLGEDRALDMGDTPPEGVIGAVAWIEEMKVSEKLDLKAKEAFVIGGGNTALDVVQELKELGVPEVSLVYRKGEEQMSGYHHELKRAKLLGVQILTNRLPKSVSAENGRLSQIEMAWNSPLGEVIETVDADLMVLAVGQLKRGDWFKRFDGVTVDERGVVQADADGQTGNPKVFTGGDCLNGGKEVVNAVAEGKRAAKAIMAYIEGANHG